jgi:hypothetical protein
MSLTMDRGTCSECGGELEEGHSYGQCGDCALADSPAAYEPVHQAFLVDVMATSRYPALTGCSCWKRSRCTPRRRQRCSRTSATAGQTLKCG